MSNLISIKRQKEQEEFAHNGNGFISGGLFDQDPSLTGGKMSMQKYLDIRGRNNLSTVSQVDSQMGATARGSIMDEIPSQMINDESNILPTN